MSDAWIALGSNLGVPEACLRQAVQRLSELPHSQGLRCSPWYCSAPIGGPPDQPDYLNAICRLDTRLAPMALLRTLQAIETEAGRERQVRWGPRTLDLDIILYDDRISDDPELTLPHPRAHERAFVVRPMCDLAPDIALHGKPVKDWLPNVAGQTIRLYQP
ncbi:MAG: 2-amino-4-hydroxy-6-hydroxymethyldihydropteridine diphosphokinase [Saccharospirillum sp.]